jgi:hypothetical protein
VTQLVDFVDSRLSAVPQLCAFSTELRTAILEVLRCAKNSFENPLDFVRSGKLKEATTSFRQAMSQVRRCFVRYLEGGGEEVKETLEKKPSKEERPTVSSKGNN